MIKAVCTGLAAAALIACGATSGAGGSLAGSTTCPDGTTCGDGQYCVQTVCGGADSGHPVTLVWSCMAPVDGCTLAPESESARSVSSGTCVYAFCSWHTAYITDGGRSINCMCG